MQSTVNESDKIQKLNTIMYVASRIYKIPSDERVIKKAHSLTHKQCEKKGRRSRLASNNRVQSIGFEV